MSKFDLELILVIGVAVTGIIWLLDKLFWGDIRRKRVMEDAFAKKSDDAFPRSKQRYKEPWYIEYSRSFFPILLLVLVLRSFIAEPFRIPSGSMMPTLLHGDFILVNKYIYGIRLPVLNNKIVAISGPKRGDVAVFRYPRNSEDDYIKRVIGLPGDHVTYKEKTLYINGQPMSQQEETAYHGKGSNEVMNGATIFKEQLEAFSHQILLRDGREDQAVEFAVPANHYFVMGDNRDNSNDSRVWGFVPEENLVGKAFLVWMNWDIGGGSFDFDRIGMKII